MAESAQDAGTQLIEEFFPEDPASNPVAAKSAPVAESKPAETPKPKHPGPLVRAAKELQFTDKEIEEYQTPKELREAIELVSMVRQQDRKEQQVMNEVQRDNQGRFVKQEPAAAVEPEFNPKDLGIDTTEWDEPTQKIMASALKPLVKQIKELESKLGEITEREIHRERETQLDELDQMFVKDDSIFGKGSRFEMTKGSAEVKRRKAMIGAMAELFQTEKGISKKECYERAKQDLFGSFQVKNEEKAEEVQEEVKPRFDLTQASSVMPTAKAHKPPPKGHATAVANLAQRLNQPSRNGDPSEFDELPD